jgi:hypothetical protein
MSKVRNKVYHVYIVATNLLCYFLLRRRASDPLVWLIDFIKLLSINKSA